jgi:hypothetical protein
MMRLERVFTPTFLLLVASILEVSTYFRTIPLSIQGIYKKGNSEFAARLSRV